MRTASFALAVAAIGVVVAAAVVSPVGERGGTTFSAADRFSGVGSDLTPTIDESKPTDGSSAPSGPADPVSAGPGAIDAPIDLDTPGADVVESGGDPTVPAVVVAAPVSATSIRVGWELVPDATGYLVDRWVEEGAGDGEGWLEIAETSAETSTFTDTGLDAATTYYYQVTAKLDGGEEAPASDVVHATTMSAPPAAPELSAKIAGNKVLLHWTDVEGETGYRIERLAPGETEWALLGTTAAGEVTVKDEDVIRDLTYQYRVIATGFGGESAASNVVEIVASISIDEDPPSTEDPEPDATEPIATGPDAIEPIAGGSGAIEMDVLEPEVMEPIVIEPDVIEPDMIDPIAVEPDPIELDEAPGD